jgi:outer membrane receptor protein involved in Fe transport
MVSMKNTRWLAAAALFCTGTAAAAQEAARQYQFDIAAAGLSASLKKVAIDAGLDLVAPAELVRGLQGPPLHGTYTADAAIDALLQGSGLTFTRTNGAILIVRSAGGANLQKGAAAKGKDSDIVVTGTKIRGAPVAAPAIVLTQDEMLNRGEATIAEAVRTIPQNFGGGQNPGVGNNVPAASGVNVGSATTINLRGLGSDATLTLVNGHRLSYSASRQAIDISSIPLGAVDRIEIVPDGSSALYGSDAVAGVANIIFRREYDGIETSARIGGATDGGDFEQRYSILGGTRWRSGGFIATYEFGRTTAVTGRDRSYTAGQSPGLTLFPALLNHSAMVSAHQDLGGDFKAEIDGLYNDRTSNSSYALNPAGDVTQSGARFLYRVKSFVVAPTLRFSPGSNWRFFLTGSFGQDHTFYDVTSYFGGLVFKSVGNCYCNEGKSAEIGGDGALLRLPSGNVKLAAGAGFRGNRLVRFNGVGSDTNISQSQDSYYAYGELSVPLVAPEQGVRLVHRLQLSAALRFEHYPRTGKVVTPKLGLIYAPGADADIKASWGRSFRAPTLYQQYEARLAVLDYPQYLGGVGFPADATVLTLEGGNPDLKPERATSWSATLGLHPRKLGGARLELSYFDTRYRDRVVAPITFLSEALSDPLYADRLTFNPGAALLDAIIADATSFGNATNAPYDPANVAVFIDNRNINAGFQRIRGGDLLVSYATSLPGDAGELSANLNGTYLESEQQLDPTQPVLAMAGTIFHPPHVGASGDVSWARGPFTLTGGVTYVGAVSDTRQSPATHVDGITTFDLTFRYQSGSGPRWRRGLSATLTVQNLFNAKPGRIATTRPSDAPYDSTNYSPVGRFVAASLVKKW